jgi:hypothetical protein
MRPVCRDETRDPDDLGLWRRLGCPVRVHTPLPASSPIHGCTRSAVQEPDDWAVSLRAAQLLAEDSLTGRRSVAPLRALLAFGEIVHRRLRVRPNGAQSINRLDTPLTRAAPWELMRVDSPSVIMHRRASTTSPP